MPDAAKEKPNRRGFFLSWDWKALTTLLPPQKKNKKTTMSLNGTTSGFGSFYGHKLLGFFFHSESLAAPVEFSSLSLSFTLSSLSLFLSPFRLLVRDKSIRIHVYVSLLYYHTMFLCVVVRPDEKKKVNDAGREEREKKSSFLQNFPWGRWRTFPHISRGWNQIGEKYRIFFHVTKKKVWMDGRKRDEKSQIR